MLPFRSVRKTVHLTNAQIKALPTTPIATVATGGAGTILFPLSATYSARFQVAYTNVDIGATLQTRFAGDNASQLGLGHFIANAGQWTVGAVGFVNQASLRGQFAAGLAFSLLGFDDTGLTVAMANASLGNLTGGHANNTLSVETRYIVLDNPAVLRLVTSQWVIDDDPSGSVPDGFLTSSDGINFTINTTAERGLALLITDGVPETFYP
jgi:hypothetical protein